jgi:lysophospholipase L1-like esterase
MLLPALVALAVAQPPAAKPFEFKDGDRVVWLGGTLVEREQRYGYWEAALLAANADKRVTVRNLGWSGDTVHGEARGRFDFNNPEKCFRQIVDQTLELKPTVIFISYGTNESFEGKGGLARFEQGLEKLLDALKPAGARVVLFTPPPAEKSQSLPDPKALNDRLALYAAAIKRIAAKRELPVADLFTDFQGRYGDERLTENGLHYAEAGYKALGRRFVAQIVPGASLSDADQLEPLRRAIVAKNELFFHRWRPQNETYLFGFRKHEQGKNAKEVAEFDPLVAKAEEEIEKLRKALAK